MRKFQRVLEPEVLQQHGKKWTTQWIQLCERNPNANFSWYQVDGRSAREHILPTLAEQTQLHCSFCDAFPVGGVSNETIEHFRPKSQFPEFAYRWSNLYYCCNACQSAKGERWDDLLLNPDEEQYSFARYFEFDFTTGEIKPNAVANDTDQRRAQTTINHYNLNSEDRQRNRKLELRKMRRSTDSENEHHLWAYRDFLGL